MKFYEMVDNKEYSNNTNTLHYKMEDRILYYFNDYNNHWEESVLSPMDLYEMNFVDIEEAQLKKEFEIFDKGITLKDCEDDVIRIATGALELQDVKDHPNDRDVYIAVGPDEDDVVMDIGLSFEQFDEICEFVNKMREFVEEVRG